MAKKLRHTAEQIIGKPREAELKLAKGTPLAQVCKDLAITEPTYDRCRKEYGGLKLDQARRLKDPEKEDARLKRLLADAELDKAILKEAASGEYWARRGDARRSSTSGACSARIASCVGGPAECRGGAARPSGVPRPPPTTSRGR